MRIYLAGKITGLSGEEAEANFMWAEMRIENAGHTPLNPLKLVDQCDTNADGSKRTYRQQLTDAVAVMLTADGVYFLDNWTDSKGARIERIIAALLEMPRYFNLEDLPIGSDWPERKD